MGFAALIQNDGITIDQHIILKRKPISALGLGLSLGPVHCVSMVVFHGRYAAEMFRVKVQSTTTVFVTATNKMILPWPLSIATINRYRIQYVVRSKLFLHVALIHFHKVPRCRGTSCSEGPNAKARKLYEAITRVFCYCTFRF